MKRTDIHRPSVFVSADYTFRHMFSCASDPDGDPLMPESIEEAIRITTLAALFGLRVWGDLGKCGHCGARYSTGAIYEHTPTGDLLCVGWQCAETQAMMSTHIRNARDAQARSLARARKAAIQASINRKALEAFCAQHEGLAEDLSADHHIISDIRSKLLRFHSISDKQVALVRKLAAEVRNPPASKPAETHCPAPEGRVSFEGVVVAKRWYDTQYGTSVKLVVKMTEASGDTWLVWVSEPGSISADKGDTVRMTATLKRGEDAHFALGSRPTKAAIVNRVDPKGPGATWDAERA